MDAVVGEDQVVFGGNGGGFIELVGDGGIVAVVEVDLKAGNAHGGVVVEENFLSVDELGPGGPEDEFDVALGGVTDEFGKVNLGDDGGDVELLGPAFVENDVGNVEEVGKVNVGFVGGGVDARGEGDVLQAPSVPPLPCDATGANPIKGVIGGGGEEVGQVILVELGGYVGHHADAPGVESPPWGFDEVGVAFQHKDIATARGINGFGGRGH